METWGASGCWAKLDCVVETIFWVLNGSVLLPKFCHFIFLKHLCACELHRKYFGWCSLPRQPGSLPLSPWFFLYLPLSHPALTADDAISPPSMQRKSHPAGLRKGKDNSHQVYFKALTWGLHKRGQWNTTLAMGSITNAGAPFPRGAEQCQGVPTGFTGEAWWQNVHECCGSFVYAEGRISQGWVGTVLNAAKSTLLWQ